MVVTEDLLAVDQSPNRFSAVPRRYPSTRQKERSILSQILRDHRGLRASIPLGRGLAAALKTENSKPKTQNSHPRPRVDLPNWCCDVQVRGCRSCRIS
jgi:hypothetical protein